MTNRSHTSGPFNPKKNKTRTLTFASILKRPEFVIPLSIILILTAFLYARALQNSILSWDDMLHITYNRDIQVLSLQNFKTIFTSFYSGMYQPFVTLSFALEYQLFGLDPVVYHATNVLFHLMNVTLVFFFVLHLTNHRTPALIAALLFGIHPMHVESVAWITERKDVVYAFFYFLALIYYVRFVNDHHRKHYGLALLFFICSLFSKSAAITLPPVLFLIDYYFHRKIKTQTIIEKVPFFILSVVFGTLSLFSQRASMNDIVLHSFSFIDRIFLISYSLCYYLLHVFVPINLSAFHLMPEKIDGILPLEYYLAIIPIIIITITLFYKTSFHHIVTFGLIFFLLTISLSIHIIPFGKAIVSERYVYVPYVGIYFLLGQCSVWIMDRYKKAIVVQKYYVVWIIAAFVIAYFGYSTYKRIQVWNNTETLFRDAALKVNNNKTAKQLQAMGYELDGEERLNAQDYSKAIEYYNTSITLNPSKAKLYHDRGYAKHFSEDFEGAMKDYSKAIELDPTYVRAYANRAIIYLKWNKQQEACADLRAAYNLGLYNIYEMVPVNCQ